MRTAARATSSSRSCLRPAMWRSGTKKPHAASAGRDPALEASRHPDGRHAVLHIAIELHLLAVLVVDGELLVQGLLGFLAQVLLLRLAHILEQFAVLLVELVDLAPEVLERGVDLLLDQLLSLLRLADLAVEREVVHELEAAAVALVPGLQVGADLLDDFV